jgi:hypothetical protein
MLVPMKNLSRPSVILTHESDLDGLVAGVLLQRLARKLFDVRVPLEAYPYHSWKQREPREPAAWVTDLSFEPCLDKAGWVFIDHHATEIFPKSAELILDTQKSASLLCYELCKEHGLGSPQLDRLVHLSNLADLFLDEDPDFATATDYASLVKVYQFWNLHRLVNGEIERLLDHPLLEVMATKRRVEDPIGYEWSRPRVVPLSPQVGYVETVVGNTNLIVNRLLEENATPHPVLLSLFRRGTLVMVASLRSRNGEALKVAEVLKGGGHPNAAGAVLPRSVKSIPQALDYLRQVLNPAPPKPAGLGDLKSLFDAIETDPAGASPDREG